jgi:hypothetical protein
VYVLISKRTFSAAEGFACDLQALRRVTVLSLAGRSINPVTGGNWQGTASYPTWTCLRIEHWRPR